MGAQRTTYDHRGFRWRRVKCRSIGTTPVVSHNAGMVIVVTRISGTDPSHVRFVLSAPTSSLVQSVREGYLGRPHLLIRYPLMLKKVPASDRLRGTRVRGGMGYTVALEAAAARIVGSTPTVPTNNLPHTLDAGRTLRRFERTFDSFMGRSSASGGMGYTSG